MNAANKRATHVWSHITDEQISATDLNRLAESVDNSRPYRPRGCKMISLPGQKIIRPLRRY